VSNETGSPSRSTRGGPSSLIDTAMCATITRCVQIS
jgi:hypothetical protein